MKSSRSIKQFAGTIIVIIGVIVLSVGKFSSLPNTGIEGADKVAHYFMYLILTLALGKDLFFLYNSFSLKWWLLTILIPCTVGALMEVAQYFLPHRSASWADMGADAIGTVVGAVVAYVLMYKYVKRRK
jgi:VanZ family protein